MNKCVVIDFYGLSGSGKTTIMNRLINELTTHGFVCAAINSEVYLQGKLVKKNKIRKYIRAFFAIKPQSFSMFFNLFRLINSIKAFDPKSIRYAFNYIYFYLQLGSGLSRTTKNDFLVTDNGLVQYLIEIMYRKDSAPDYLLERIIHKIDKQFGNRIYFIHVDIDVIDAINRINERGKEIRLSSLSNKEAEAELLKESREIAVITNLILRSKNIRLIQIRNTRGKEHLNTLVYKILDELQLNVPVLNNN